jgi:hypothetical protein
LDWSHRPSAWEQAVVVVPATRAHRLSLVVVLPVAVLRAVAVVDLKAMEQAAHAVRQVLAVTAFFWSTKSLEYEQSLRHPWWHRPQHHRP